MKYLLSMVIALVLCSVSSATHYRARVLLVPVQVAPVAVVQQNYGTFGSCGVNNFGAYGSSCGVGVAQTAVQVQAVQVRAVPVLATPVYAQNFGVVNYGVGVRNFNNYGSFGVGVRGFQFQQRTFRFNRVGVGAFSFSRTVIR